MINIKNKQKHISNTRRQSQVLNQIILSRLFMLMLAGIAGAALLLTAHSPLPTASASDPGTSDWPDVGWYRRSQHDFKHERRCPPPGT